MRADGDAALEATLAKLRERYRQTSGRTVERFRELAARLAHAPAAREVLEEVRRELHRVRGTAGSYGFAEASELAARLEPRAVRWMEAPEVDDDRRAALVRHFADALEAALAEPGTAAVPRRLLVLLDVPDTMAAAIAAEAPLQGFAMERHEAGAWTPAPDALPSAVVTTAAAAVAVRDRVAASQAPLVVLADGATPPDTPGDVVVAVAPDDVASLFDVLEQAALRTSTAGARLLVLDDDPDVLALVAALMAPEGVTVTTLEAPEGLAAALEAVRPAALLMDVGLGGHDGLALTRGLRQDPAWRDLPIVLFSGDSDAARREAAYAAGADDFVAKPIVADELRRRLLARLEARRRTRLGEACHPGTGLPLPSRTVREAARTLEAAAGQGRPAVLAIVRAAGDAPRGGRAAAWLQELDRLGHALRDPGGTVGMLDDDALLVVAPADPPTLARRLAALAAERNPDVPAWHAGLAALDAAHRTLDALRRGADEAHAAAAAEGEVAHTWRSGDDEVPPDVVVIEDDRALADMITFALRSAGFTHRAFADGREAHDALLALRTGGRRVVVICDVDLPGLDGHALHERIRTARPGAFLFVFASSHASEAEQLRALGAGALDWLTKPLSVRVLVAKAKHWVAIAGAGRT